MHESKGDRKTNIEAPDSSPFSARIRVQLNATSRSSTIHDLNPGLD